MKRWTTFRNVFVLSLLAAVILGGCATASTSQPDTASQSETTETDTLSAQLPDDYEGAISPRNQLALGTLRLEGTSNAITPEQAQTLTALWQALDALSKDSTSATEETTAVQNQIVAAMTDAQIQAIAAMKLTNDDLNQFYEEQGLTISTPEPGATPSGMGKNSGMSQEDREAAKATAVALGTPVGTGSGGGSERRDVLMNVLIAMLEQRSAE